MTPEPVLLAIDFTAETLRLLMVEPGGSPLGREQWPLPELADAKAWSWEPILVMKKGRSYRVRLSSVDLQHGFSLQPTNLNLMVLPGYEYVATLTPNETGEYLIVCNEYCGLGHHKMVGKIIVTD